MKAIILAGGLGHRLRPFTEVIPKPLLPLGEQSIMEIQIRMLVDAGVDEVIVATNYMSDLVQAYLGDGSRFGVKVDVSREEIALGTCGPISLLRHRLREPFILMNGDILTKLNFATFYKTAVEDEAELVVGTKIITTPFRFGNVSVSPDSRIIGIEEKPEFALEIVAGIYCIKPTLFELIPIDTYYGMDSLIKDMLVVNRPVGRYLIEDYWLDIGQVDDYGKARDAYETHFKSSDVNPIATRRK